MHLPMMVPALTSSAANNEVVPYREQEAIGQHVHDNMP
jgi:hypothetical protein